MLQCGTAKSGGIAISGSVATPAYVDLHSCIVEGNSIVSGGEVGGVYLQLTANFKAYQSSFLFNWGYIWGYDSSP